VTAGTVIGADSTPRLGAPLDSTAGVPQMAQNLAPICSAAPHFTHVIRGLPKKKCPAFLVSSHVPPRRTTLGETLRSRARL
jgi:hypothetical protein